MWRGVILVVASHNILVVSAPHPGFRLCLSDTAPTCHTAHPVDTAPPIRTFTVIFTVTSTVTSTVTFTQVAYTRSATVTVEYRICTALSAAVVRLRGGDAVGSLSRFVYVEIGAILPCRSRLHRASGLMVISCSDLDLM